MDPACGLTNFFVGPFSDFSGHLVLDSDKRTFLYTYQVDDCTHLPHCRNLLPLFSPPPAPPAPNDLYARFRASACSARASGIFLPRSLACTRTLARQGIHRLTIHCVLAAPTTMYRRQRARRRSRDLSFVFCIRRSASCSGLALPS